MKKLKNLWREYGLLTLLIAVAMVGYFYYSQHREDLLAYSLDVLGERLVAMVDGPEAQAAVAARFDGFKAHVLGGDMSTAEVEIMAANVLNLSDNGARLNEAEAAMVLRPAPPPPVGTPPSPGAAPTFDVLGERLGAMLAFHHEIQAAVGEAPAVRQALAEHLRFVTEGGLHVVIDPATAERLPAPARARLAEATEQLASQHRLRWQAHLADTLRATRARAEAERAVFVALRRQHERTAAVVSEAGAERGEALEMAAMQTHFAVLESLKQLEALGYLGVRPDSLERVVRQAVEAAMAAPQASSGARATVRVDG